MEPRKEIKRGEMWYISAPNSNPASAALGRPAIVLSNDKACAAAPEIAVVYTTTNMAKSVLRDNVPVFSPERDSTARCNGVPLIPRQWFQYKMCDISEEELRAIEKGLFYALDISVDEEMRDLKRQLSFYKALYRETLNELARKTLDDDLAAMMDEMRHPGVVQVTAEDLINNTYTVPVEEEQPTPSEPTEEDELAELERQLAELEAEEPTEPDPADPTDPAEEPPKKMVNVNNASWWDLHRKFGIDQDTARAIIGERIRAKGRFQSVEEVLNLRCLSKKDIKKMEGRIEL